MRIPPFVSRKYDWYVFHGGIISIEHYRAGETITSPRRVAYGCPGGKLVNDQEACAHAYTCTQYAGRRCTRVMHRGSTGGGHKTRMFISCRVALRYVCTRGAPTAHVTRTEMYVCRLRARTYIECRCNWLACAGSELLPSKRSRYAYCTAFTLPFRGTARTSVRARRGTIITGSSVARRFHGRDRTIQRWSRCSFSFPRGGVGARGG